MRKPEQYHEARVCTDAMHPWDERPVVVSIPLPVREKLRYTGPLELAVSPATIMEGCKKTMKRKKGGSLFSNKEYWVAVMPEMKPVMAQGGVSCRIKNIKRGKVRNFTNRLLSQTNEERVTMWVKMQDMQKQGLIEDVPENDPVGYHNGQEVPEYVSPSFCQEKPGKEHLPIPEANRCLTDMKSSGSNRVAVCNKFKQEGMIEVHGLVKPGDLLITYDLSDAYGQALVLVLLRKLSRTLVSEPDKQGNHVRMVKKQYCTLSQGWSPAPELFTKLLRAPLRVLRSLGLRIVHKIDDLLLIVSSLYEARLHGYILMWFLSELGAVFSAQKGLYDGRKRVLWHGFVICTEMMMTSMPPEKVTKIVSLMRQTLQMLETDETEFTLRWVATVIGVVMAGIDGISAVRLHTLALARWRLWCMKRNSGKSGWDVEYKIGMLQKELKHELVVEMKYWCRGYESGTPETIHWNGRVHQSGAAVVTIFTDACNYQWGLQIAEDKTRGYPEVRYKRPFHGDQLGWHITLQETYGAAQGVLETVKERDLWDCVVLARVDATTAVKYVRCLGGKKQAHAKAVMPMEEECIRRRIEVRCFHVPGEMNPADAPSRDLVGKDELSLDGTVMALMEVELAWGPWEVDCFAAQWNNTLPVYYTWERGDPKAAAVDAFTADWTQGNQWMFPPMHKQMQTRIMQRMLHLVSVGAEMEATLVVPLWKVESLVQLLGMMVCTPLVIPVEEWVLKLPSAYTHNQDAQSLAKKVQWSTLVPTKCMIAMRLSSRACVQGVYLRTLQKTLGEYTNKIEMETTVAGILHQNGRTLFSGSSRRLEGLQLMAEIMLLQMNW